MKRVSIARARDSLTRLVREVEGGRTIELTRRERPVAALIPLSELRRLTAARPRFAEAVSDFRASLSPADLEAIGKAFVIPRERSPGREVELYYTPPKSPRGSQISRERAPQAPAAAGGEAGEAALAADAGEDLPPPLDRQRGRARRDWAAGVPAL